jgi:crossover junction endodeoxyribonuclease RuvC
MIVVGIDPGIANTGYGVVRRRAGRLVALDGGVMRTRSERSPEHRLADLFVQVEELLDRHNPDALALEAIYFGQNVRSAFAVGQARGVVLMAAGRRSIPCED